MSTMCSTKVSVFSFSVLLGVMALAMTLMTNADCVRCESLHQQNNVTETTSSDIPSELLQAASKGLGMAMDGVGNGDGDGDGDGVDTEEDLENTLKHAFFESILSAGQPAESAEKKVEHELRQTQRAQDNYELQSAVSKLYSLEMEMVMEGLEGLEDLVHDFEMAQDLVALNVYQKLLELLQCNISTSVKTHCVEDMFESQNHREMCTATQSLPCEDIPAMAALVIGSAAQNKPPVAQHLVDMRMGMGMGMAVPKALVHLIEGDPESSQSRRAIYALSCLSRASDTAAEVIQSLISPTISQLLHSENVSIRRKSIRLLHSLAKVRDMDADVWCSYAGELIPTREPAALEAVLSLLQHHGSTCAKHIFSRRNLDVIYEIRHESDDEFSVDVAKSIIEMRTQLQSPPKRTVQHDDSSSPALLGA